MRITPALLGVIAAGRRRDTGDPFWAQVLLLAHFNGTNGSSTFTDSSSSALTASVYSGSPVLTTGNFKYGTASLSPGGGAVQWASPATTGSTAFTIESWVYRTGTNTYAAIFYGANGNIALKLDAGSGSSTYRVTAESSSLTQITSTTAIGLNTWYHVALSSQSTTGSQSIWRLAVNGTVEATSSNATRSALTAGSFYCGRNDSSGFTGYPGQIDDLRVTNACRFTGNFTAPSAEYPNS